MISIIKKFMCRKQGHSDSILEVHNLKDIIRCSRCNKIQKTFYKTNNFKANSKI